MVGQGQGGSKKFKSNLVPPHGTRLKSRPIPAPPPLRGRGNLRETKQGGWGVGGGGSETR